MGGAVNVNIWVWVWNTLSQLFMVHSPCQEVMEPVLVDEDM